MEFQLTTGSQSTNKATSTTQYQNTHNIIPPHPMTQLTSWSNINLSHTDNLSSSQTGPARPHQLALEVSAVVKVKGHTSWGHAHHSSSGQSTAPESHIQQRPTHRLHMSDPIRVFDVGTFLYDTETPVANFTGMNLCSS